MAENKSSSEAQAKSPAAKTAAPPAEPSPAPAPTVLLGRPVNLTYKKKKRKKRKYSSDFKDLGKLERGWAKAVSRVGTAVRTGARSYRRRSNKSARKRRDGSLRDFLENSSYGLGRAVGKASLAPYDIAKRLNTKRVRRQLRDAARLLPIRLY